MKLTGCVCRQCPISATKFWSKHKIPITWTKLINSSMSTISRYSSLLIQKARTMYAKLCTLTTFYRQLSNNLDCIYPVYELIIRNPLDLCNPRHSLEYNIPTYSKILILCLISGLLLTEILLPTLLYLPEINLYRWPIKNKSNFHFQRYVITYTSRILNYLEFILAL